MKRLRRFNESKTEIDYDYVYQCFAELLDDNKAEIREIKNGIETPLPTTGKLSAYNHYIVIDLKIRRVNPLAYFKRIYKIENSKLLDYINDIKSNSELLQEVEVALNRLSEKYPEYRVSFDVQEYSTFINIHSGE
jgi:hypothetical protein